MVSLQKAKSQKMTNKKLLTRFKDMANLANASYAELY